MVGIRVWFLFVGVMFAGVCAFGDTVTLKNGNVLKGVITAENPESIQFEEMGMKLWIKRSKIKSIDRSSESERKELLSSLSKPRPPRTPPIPKEAGHLQRLMNEANQRLHEKNQTVRQVESKQQQVENLNAQGLNDGDRLIEMMNELEATRPSKKKNKYGAYEVGYNKRVRAYNQKVIEHDEFLKQKRVRGRDLSLARRDVALLTDTLHGQVAEYQQARADFMAAWERFHIDYPEDKLERGAWFDRFASAAEQHGKIEVPTGSKRIDVKRTPKGMRVTVRSDDRGHFQIPVMINKKKAVSLLFDTGASVTIVSSDIAEAAGLKTIGEPYEVKVADGRKVKARMAIANQFDVCGVPYTNEKISVLEKEEGDDVSGLLGLTFINKVKYSVENQILVMTLE